MSVPERGQAGQSKPTPEKSTVKTPKKDKNQKGVSTQTPPPSRQDSTNWREDVAHHSGLELSQTSGANSVICRRSTNSCIGWCTMLIFIVIAFMLPYLTMYNYQLDEDTYVVNSKTSNYEQFNKLTSSSSLLSSLQLSLVSSSKSLPLILRPLSSVSLSLSPSSLLSSLLSSISSLCSVKNCSSKKCDKTICKFKAVDYYPCDRFELLS